MNIYIESISVYLPEKVLTNDDIALSNPEWNIHEITNHTGVVNRHIAEEDEIASDMAVKAAEKLFEEHSIDRNTIDYIIFCSIHHDYKTPTTACILQDRLKLSRNSGALDINHGCTGYIYGLSIAQGIIMTESAKRILFLTSETISKMLDSDDKSTVPIFGDGATASLITATSEGLPNINKFVFGTDGKGYDSIILKHSASRDPKPEKIFKEIDQYGNKRLNTSFYMHGSKVFLFSLKTVPKLVLETLEKNRLEMKDIDMFIFHQASKIIIENITKKLKIPTEKYYLYLEKCGNTSASTIPIAIYNADKENKIKRGNVLMLVGFGTGFSWGATVINY